MYHSTTTTLILPRSYHTQVATKKVPGCYTYVQRLCLPKVPAGPQAIIDTFATVNRIWANEAFEVQTLFGAGEDVAVFGKFTYRSRSLGKVSVSPFSIWCKVNEESKVTYMQFMEDTLGSTDRFKKGGQKQYVVFEENGEIEV